jgi:hypothetical protein
MPFVEPVTRHTFQTVVTYDGQTYTLMGVGARKVWGAKVYAMALYVEDEPARKAFPKLAAQAGGADHDSLLHADLAHKFIVLGEFGKTALIHFTHDVSAKDSRDAYRKALGDAIGANASSDLKRDAEAFLALFDDVKDGDDVLIRTMQDGKICVEHKGKLRAGPTNQRLSHDIWDIWLGAKPISDDLKKGIVDRIDTLGR